MTLSNLTDASIDNLLHDQERPVSHDVTMGVCANGCGNAARGGGICAVCLKSEIVKRERERKERGSE